MLEEILPMDVLGIAHTGYVTPMRGGVLLQFVIGRHISHGTITRPQAIGPIAGASNG